MKEPTHNRAGRFITDLRAGVKVDYKTINAAKKASREMQKSGAIMVAEKQEPLRKTSFLRMNRFSKKTKPVQRTEFKRPITDAELAEIADTMLATDPSP